MMRKEKSWCQTSVTSDDVTPMTGKLSSSRYNRSSSYFSWIGSRKRKYLMNQKFLRMGSPEMNSSLTSNKHQSARNAAPTKRNWWCIDHIELPGTAGICNSIGLLDHWDQEQLKNYYRRQSNLIILHHPRTRQSKPLVPSKLGSQSNTWSTSSRTYLCPGKPHGQ